jgi:hypothetical protein
VHALNASASKRRPFISSTVSGGPVVPVGSGDETDVTRRACVGHRTRGGRPGLVRNGTSELERPGRRYGAEHVDAGPSPRPGSAHEEPGGRADSRTRPDRSLRNSLPTSRAAQTKPGPSVAHAARVSGPRKAGEPPPENGAQRSSQIAVLRLAGVFGSPGAPTRGSTAAEPIWAERRAGASSWRSPIRAPAGGVIRRCQTPPRMGAASCRRFLTSEPIRLRPPEMDRLVKSDVAHPAAGVCAEPRAAQLTTINTWSSELE